MTDVASLIKDVETIGKTFANQNSAKKLEVDRLIANISSCFEVIENTFQQIQQKDVVISKRLENMEKVFRKRSTSFSQPVIPSLQLRNVDLFEDDENSDDVSYFGKNHKRIPSITIRSPSSNLSSSDSSDSDSDPPPPYTPPRVPTAPPPPPISLTITPPMSPTLDFSSVKLRSSPLTSRVPSPSDALMSEMASKLLQRRSTSFNNLENAVKKGSPEKKLNKSSEMSSSSPVLPHTPRLSPSSSPSMPTNSPRDVPFVTDKVISYEKLKSKKDLPSDVNVSALEAYLSQGEFFKVFGMSRETFNKLPRWQKDNKKKAVHLY